MGMELPRRGGSSTFRWGSSSWPAWRYSRLRRAGRHARVPGPTAITTACAEGEGEAAAEGEGAYEGEAEQEAAAAEEATADGGTPGAGSAVSDFYSGPAHEVPCAEGPGHPESFADLAVANSSRLTRTVAPGTRIKPGAYRAALQRRAALDLVGGPWSAYGKPPLQSNRTEYDTTNGSTEEGLGDLSGRVNAFANDNVGPRTRRSPTAASGGRPTISTGPRSATRCPPRSCVRHRLDIRRRRHADRAHGRPRLRR